MTDTRLRLRLLFPGAMLGPGKIELLEQIRAEGSISAAGRAMGMSYKRAWSLVEEMNAAFREPLIASSRGGAGGGGAHLTVAGETVLAHYHAVIDAAQTHAGDHLAALRGMLADISDGK